MKKAALWVLVPLFTLLILACPNPASTGGGGGGGSGTTTITSEGSLAAPVVLDYSSFRECQIDADSPSWYEFSIPANYDIRIKINGISPALESVEFIDVYLSNDKNNLPSVPTFSVTNANMNEFKSFNNLEAGTWFLMVDSPYKSVRFNITMTASDPDDDDDDDDDPVDGDSEGSFANPVPLTLGKYRPGSVGASSPSYYSLDVPLDGVSYFIKLYDISPAPSVGGNQVYADVFYTESVSGDYEERALLAFPEDNDHQVFYFSHAGTLDIRVNEDHPCTFKLVVSIHDYSDLSQYPEEGEGFGTLDDPWVILVDSPRTVPQAAFNASTYLTFDAAVEGADYTVRIELEDSALNRSGWIFCNDSGMEYEFTLDEEITEYSFSAVGEDWILELANVEGNSTVTLSEAASFGRWEPVGDTGFSTGSVLDKDLAYNPGTGELWAVCREQRGTTIADIVLAVYRAGVGNNSWTEVTSLPAMTNPALPKIAVDSQGIVYVGYNEDFGAHRYMALLKYDGSSWSSVGDPDDIQYGTDPQNITLLVDGDDKLHVLWCSDTGQDVDQIKYFTDLKYFTWDGSTLVSEGFDEDLDCYNFAAVLDGLGNVRLGVSWRTPFYKWETGIYDYATGNFIEVTGAYDDHTANRDTVLMAAASDGTPWAILRDTLGYQEYQYRLWKLTADGMVSAYDFPEYSDIPVEYICGLALSGTRPAILSSRDGAPSVRGYEPGSSELVLLGERWLAYDTLRDGQLFAGKDGELYVIGYTFTNEDDPADKKLSVYTWEQ